MRIAVGISGASGTVYGQRLVQVLLEQGVEVILTLSKTLDKLFAAELGLVCDPANPDIGRLFGERAAAALASKQLTVHRADNLAANVASGSFLVDGYVICPASTGLIGRASVGASTNLLERMCDVALKERRTLVLVPRETPLSTIQLRAMTRLSSAGATILPAAPGFYHRPRTLADAVDFVVQKIIDRLGVKADLIRRWC